MPDKEYREFDRLGFKMVTILDNTSKGYKPIDENGEHCNTLTFFSPDEATKFIKKWNEEWNVGDLEDPQIVNVNIEEK